jgi:hypothetical protein
MDYFKGFNSQNSSGIKMSAKKLPLRYLAASIEEFIFAISTKIAALSVSLEFSLVSEIVTSKAFISLIFVILEVRTGIIAIKIEKDMKYIIKHVLFTSSITFLFQATFLMLTEEKMSMMTDERNKMTRIIGNAISG